MASSSNSTIDIDVPSVSEVTFKTIGKCGDTFTHFEAVSKNELVEMSHNSTQASTSADSDHDTCCTFCKKTFTSEWHRNWHIKRMHNELGIFCDICNALFTTISSYKSHYDVQHPINGKSKQTVKSECLPSNTDQLIVRENDLLRMKIKTLKEKLKETEKYRSKELKSLEKKMKKRVEEQLLGLLTTCCQFFYYCYCKLEFISFIQRKVLF